MCLSAFDFKIGKVTYENVGQMNIYGRMFDELKCLNGYNPDMGVILTNMKPL
ncbi:hypothetical protein ACVW0P_002558 [Mucilaginibacter sp. UYNi724]